MAKKDNALPKPDYEKLTDATAEKEIELAKNTICRKVRQMIQTKEAKKEAVGAFNEQLTEVNEELDHYSAVLEELQAVRKRIAAKAQSPLLTAVPAPAAVASAKP